MTKHVVLVVNQQIEMAADSELFGPFPTRDRAEEFALKCESRLQKLCSRDNLDESAFTIAVCSIAKPALRDAYRVVEMKLHAGVDNWE
jgi:hypothetical protein